MEAFFVGLVIGAVVGAGVTLLGIFGNYKVKDKEWWGDREREMDAAHSCMSKLMIENTQLRVALAAAEMTEGGKKMAAMTMAVLEASIGTEKTT